MSARGTRPRAARPAGTGARTPAVSPPGAGPAAPCRSGPAPAQPPWRPSAGTATTTDGPSSTASAKVLGAGRNLRTMRTPARALREALSTITLVWADAGYTGRFVRDARNIWDLAVAIVKRPDQAKGFVLLHRRWVVERSFAWLTKFRRLVRDDETLPATHEAMIWTTATWQLSNRLTR